MKEKTAYKGQLYTTSIDQQTDLPTVVAVIAECDHTHDTERKALLCIRRQRKAVRERYAVRLRDWTGGLTGDVEFDDACQIHCAKSRVVIAKQATVDIYNDDDLGFVCTAWEPDTYDEGPPKEIIHETFSREHKEPDLRWSQQIPFNRLLTRLWQAGYTKVAWGNAWDEQPPTWAKKMIHRFNTDGFAVAI